MSIYCACDWRCWQCSWCSCYRRPHWAMVHNVDEETDRLDIRAALTATEARA